MGYQCGAQKVQAENLFRFLMTDFAQTLPISRETVSAASKTDTSWSDCGCFLSWLGFANLSRYNLIRFSQICVKTAVCSHEDQKFIRKEN